MVLNNAKTRKRKLDENEGPTQDAVEDDAEEMDWSDEEGTRVDGIYIPPAAKPVCSFDPHGPRLIITKIVNHFFKSYAEKQVLGPFHKCFNAIVGPNGSGKSNVIDSMLFVFGYRAAKIRSKKVSVLLHSSSSYQNVQSCTVSVHFAVIIDKAGDEYDIVPGSEFVVSRTASKDNSSFYELNGKRVQFKEVAILLRKHGVDLDHNRFLILQGEVEQIAMMKNKGESEHETGMLEYLEDIIGTSRYKKPLVQLHERVEILAEQRTEKLNRLKLVEKELEELSEPMKEAVGFLKTENTVVYSKNFLYQKNIHDLEAKVKVCEEEKNKVAEAHAELLGKLKELNEEKAEKEQKLKQQSGKYQQLEKRKEKLKESFDNANTRDMQLQADMTQINKNRKKTKELLEEEKKKLAEYKRVPEKSAEGIAECEAKETELIGRKEQFEEEKTAMLASLRSETRELQEKKEVIQTELVELNKVVDETRSAFQLAESELQIYLANEENEKTKLANLKETLDTTRNTIKERGEAVVQLKKKIPLTEKSLNSALKEFNELKAEEQQIVNTVRKKRSSLEEMKSSMQASHSRGRVLDSLMQQKNNGNCPGFFGRLGDLGAIDKKYDVAISTACGPLDNLVVDTVSTAQWCIEFLKQHDIGRATLIALEKQEHLRQQANSKIKTPENVHRLFDLVQVQDERVRPAFYYALRDTLVANDLEQASRIAYGAQRYRVVTLDGDLIETTGTMSGGGRTVSRGRMGQNVAVTNVDPQEVENRQEELNSLEERVRQLRQQQSSLENQINCLQPELRKMKVDYEKFSMELKAATEQEPLLVTQLREQEAKARATKADPVQVKKLKAVVEKKQADYEKAAGATEQLQSEVNILTTEIKEKTQGKMKAIDKKISDAAKTIDKCKAEITRLKVAVKTAERNTKKSEEKISTMQNDIETAENKLRTMKSERDEIEADAAKLLTCINEITEQLTEGEDEYTEIKQEVANLSKAENKLKSEKIDVDQQLKTVNKKLNDYTSTIHQWHAKISQLKLQDIPDETVEELKTYSSEEFEQMNLESVERDLVNAESQLKAAKPNLNAIQEYQKQQSIFVERSKELEAISTKRAEMRSIYDGLRNQRKEEFLIGYNIIKLKLKEMYQMITLGGDADFEMPDSFDPFTEGVQFNVRPPKKSWKKISNLSGGEKTLSSLALVFALHYYKPSPLYVMDEIDAALDFKNVSIVGHYIKERTKNAQFIIISLRSNMFELCDNLVGIFKTYNCTKSVTIDPRIYDKQTVTDSMAVATIQPGQNPNNQNVENIPSASEIHAENDEAIEDQPASTLHVENIQSASEIHVENNEAIEDQPASILHVENIQSASEIHVENDEAIEDQPASTLHVENIQSASGIYVENDEATEKETESNLHVEESGVVENQGSDGEELENVESDSQIMVTDQNSIINDSLEMSEGMDVDV